MKISLKSKYFSLPIIAALLTACSQNEENIKFYTDGISFNASIGQNHTRATEEAFETNDEISVFAFKKEAGFSGEEYAHNRKYSFQNQLFTADEQNRIKQPDDGSQLSYVAVYPYSEATDAKFTFQVRADQSVGSNYTQSDLMMGTTYLTDIQTPTLMFSHCLSSIVVNLSFAKVPAGNVSVKIANVSTTATVNLTTAAFTGSGEASQSVTAAYNGTNSYKAILPPQKTNTGNTGIEIIIGDAAPLSYKFSTSTEWKSGIRYSYTLYVAEDGTVSDVAPEATIKKRLMKMTTEDDIGEDEVYGYSYNLKYDEQGRIIEGEGVMYGHYTGTESFKFSYSGNTITTEYENIEIDEATYTYTATQTHTLNDEGLIIKTSSRATDLPDAELTYSYTNGYMTGIIQNTNGNVNTYSFEYTNEKMTKMWLNEGHYTVISNDPTKNYKSPINLCGMLLNEFADADLGVIAFFPNTHLGKGMKYLPTQMDGIWWRERPLTTNWTYETDADGYVTRIKEVDQGGNITTYTFTYEDVTN